MAGQNGCCWLERGGAAAWRAQHVNAVQRQDGYCDGSWAAAFSVGDIFTHRVRSPPPLTADA